MEKIQGIETVLSMYKNKKLIFWGAGFHGKLLLEKFKCFGINVFAFCDNNPMLCGTKIDNIPVISPQQLGELVSRGEDVLVQLTLYTEIDKNIENVIVQQMEQLGIQQYIPYSSSQIYKRFLYIKANDLVDFRTKYTECRANEKIRITKIDGTLDSVYTK